MLVEIPDPDVILSVITAFVVGVLGLFLFYKIKPYINVKRNSPDPAYLERLEHYERQLIDMKIRLDALDISSLTVSSEADGLGMRDPTQNAPQSSPATRVAQKPVEIESQKPQNVPNVGYSDITDYVLHLITDKSLTSRDIQVTIGKTREHTARLMKKLYDDGLVERKTGTKPYAYTISKKGKEKLGLMEQAPAVA